MVKFGKYLLEQFNVRTEHCSVPTLIDKLIFKVIGYPFVGRYLRSIHFLKEMCNFNGASFKNILDAGCGTGEYSFYLAEKYPQAEIDAYDVNQEQIADNIELQKKIGVKNINFKCADLNNLREKNKYDFAVAVDIFSTLSYEENLNVFKKIYEALSPGGYFYMHIVTNNIMKSDIVSKEQHPKIHEKYKDACRGHLFTFGEIEEQLKQTGFIIKKSGETFGALGRHCWSREQIYVAGGLKKMQIAAFPLFKLLCRIDAAVPCKNGICAKFLLQKPKEFNNRRAGRKACVKQAGL